VSEKTHKPSAKRIKDAREEGNVAKIDSLPHLLAAAGAFELLNATSHQWLSQGPELLASFIARLGDTNPATRVAVKDVLIPLGSAALAAALVALMVAALLALIGNVVQTGIVIASKGVAKLERLDPIAHAKQMFTVEQLQNLIVSVVKAVAVFGLVSFGVLMSLDSLLHMAGGTLTQAAITLLSVVITCERMVLMVLIVFIIIEWWIRKRAHTEQLRMSRDEVEREQKDQFGNKHVRQGRNEFRRDMLAGELTENTRKANALVTNPTHFAVALLYDPAKYPLPVVVARGTDAQAALMRKVARDAGIPVIRSVQLARTLYSTGRSWHPVPRLTLKAVAAVYRVVAEIKAGTRDIDEYIELQDERDDDTPA
jgi:type III secretion protein U